MQPMIQTDALSFSYPVEEGQRRTTALEDVTLSIEKGSFVVVLGHNGSGKSTLAKHMNAVLLPSGGAVYVEGMDTKKEELLLEIRRRVGMVFQNPDNQIVANVVEEDVAFAPENLGVASEEIRRRVDPALELETFCHGAMCVSYSGRCLLSNYMTGRDSNRGACAQPCRYQYALMEEKRPGEYFPVFEDEKGTYIMNSRDMCMIDHLDDLMDAGVDCLKIEGRAKSAYYAAIVTGAYRHVLDDVAAGRPVDPVWRDEVEHVSHRHYSTGFFYGQPGQFYEDARYIRDWQICAVVMGCTPEGLATLSLRNKFAAGDAVEVVGPDTKPFSMTAPMMTDADGLTLAEPKTPQMVFTMQLPRPVPPMSFVRHAVDLGGR